MWNGLRKQLINKLGGYTEAGYPDAESAINAVHDVKERRRLLTLAVKKCFNTIGPEDILQMAPSGKWMVEGREITTGDRDRLIAEANQFEGSFLWKILQTDIRYQANKVTFLKAETEDDLTAGKLWQYTFDVMRTRIKGMAKGTTEMLTEKLLKNKPR